MMRNSKLDLRCFPPPLAILHVQRALNDLRDGQILEILLSDPETCLDMSQLLGPRVKGAVQVRQTEDGWWLRMRK
ncbi:MAG: sulfurtransferase TusA family protein [Thermodesulfobacteriota bacterium]